MPIFFIISGYFFTFKHQETLPFKIYFVKKIKTLLIPYIIIGLLLYYPLYSLLRLCEMSTSPLIVSFLFQLMSLTAVP